MGSRGRGFSGGQEGQSGHFHVFDDQHCDPERSRTEGESQVILRAPVRQPPGVCWELLRGHLRGLGAQGMNVYTLLSSAWAGLARSQSL